MSATFVTFTPSTNSVFSFQPSLNGTLYNVTVTWNIFGQRFYVNVYDLSNNLILARALVSSGPTLQASFTWANGWAQAQCTNPHNVPVGRVVTINVSQTGGVFDGDFSALVNGNHRLTWQTSNPNAPTVVNGNVNFSWNLILGYVAGAYLLYHFDTQQFEFGP
jgi:hypothetical protein